MVSFVYAHNYGMDHHGHKGFVDRLELSVEQSPWLPARDFNVVLSPLEHMRFKKKQFLAYSVKLRSLYVLDDKAIGRLYKANRVG